MGESMLTKFAAKNTDRTRRAALELAIQLPEDVAEARAVLVQTGDLLEGFLIRVPRDIWNRPAGAADNRGALIAHECALCWTMISALALAPVAASLAYVLECEAVSGFVLFIGVAAAALVFGQIYGVIFSALAVVAHNLLSVPPVYEFSVPTRGEVVRAVGFVVLAIALPMIANAAQRLRGLALSGAEPLFAAAPRSPSLDRAEAPSLSPDK
ncbi:DUF4118 domain-containing protein [Bradyrhizobium diazoefficiens]|nr:DUF4118 domain-containing protein [Bradyrhizobium diazoefficiens]WAX24305.1 DUF4118 domain-containing protein [Bradyrhizobium phage ppBdUSDA122-1]APO53487.1 hypothetical protein BD122_24480 [Bradyrhizobium diazoefficiens]MCD9294926.1 DUF4118 domain-containing protein [Bradyrhizobium diazoefficiens]MCD9813475.1 DUF4118 domain-containing protein [Bradyrhizobium diazoefficiens]MCD9830024.1 DUF4118 domain-containing protein [Bradyrhizobium diazoefficiens]